MPLNEGCLSNSVCVTDWYSKLKYYSLKTMASCHYHPWPGSNETQFHLAKGCVNGFQSIYSWPLNVGVRDDDALHTWKSSHNLALCIHNSASTDSTNLRSHSTYSICCWKGFVYKWTCTVRTHVVQGQLYLRDLRKHWIYRVYSWHMIYVISIEQIDIYTFHTRRERPKKEHPFGQHVSWSRRSPGFVSWHIRLEVWLSKSWLFWVSEIFSNFNKIKLTPIKKWQVQKLFANWIATWLSPFLP